MNSSVRARGIYFLCFSMITNKTSRQTHFRALCQQQQETCEQFPNQALNFAKTKTQNKFLHRSWIMFDMQFGVSIDDILRDEDPQDWFPQPEDEFSTRVSDLSVEREPSCPSHGAAVVVETIDKDECDFGRDRFGGFGASSTRTFQSEHIILFTNGCLQILVKTLSGKTVCFALLCS